MLRIFVQDRGWVVIGEFTDSEIPNCYKLKRAGVVRRWGTTAGLGQLADQGPQPETIIDLAPQGIEISCNIAFPVFICNDEAWRNWNR